MKKNDANKKVNELMKQYIDHNRDLASRAKLVNYICSDESGYMDKTYSAFIKKYPGVVLERSTEIEGKKLSKLPDSFITLFFIATSSLIDNYKGDKGAAFTTYFRSWIAERIISEIEKDGMNIFTSTATDLDMLKQSGISDEDKEEIRNDLYKKKEKNGDIL